MKKAVIIGAGPAGLTAAYELLTASDDFEVIVCEKDDIVGGISRTVRYKGNRMDMGGHRFFSKIDRVNKWWDAMLPLQGTASMDDRILGRKAHTVPGGPDPDKCDEVMLFRNRISRILFESKFYDYPITLSRSTIKNMGVGETFLTGMSYLRSLIFPLPEDNLENFYVNRFGRRLYNHFFEYYTENLWGRHPSEIDASWGAQRVKGLSITAVLADIFSKIIKKDGRKVETSLIEEFKYPKLGPGQLWETVADRLTDRGGKVLLGAKITRLTLSSGRITSVTYASEGGDVTIEPDLVISSMPVRDLIEGMNDVPDDILRIAKGLPYRDYVTCGILLDKLCLKNLTDIPTLGNIIPDCWVYVQDRSVRLGRIQIYNNWSPYLVADPEHTVWIGLEYFVNEGDDIWNMSDEDFVAMASGEIVKLGIISSSEGIRDSHVERIQKAYPAYFDTYKDMDKIISFLDGIENLYCVGRNGQHRYNNMDHSMMTSFMAVDNILNGGGDRSAIWNVNTEQEYHEES